MTAITPGEITVLVTGALAILFVIGAAIAWHLSDPDRPRVVAPAWQFLRECWHGPLTLAARADDAPLDAEDEVTYQAIHQVWVDLVGSRLPVEGLALARRLMVAALLPEPSPWTWQPGDFAASVGVGGAW